MAPDIVLDKVLPLAPILSLLILLLVGGQRLTLYKDLVFFGDASPYAWAVTSWPKAWTGYPKNERLRLALTCQLTKYMLTGRGQAHSAHHFLHYH